MKEYKKTYCTSLFWWWIDFFVMLAPMFLVCDICLWYFEEGYPGMAMLVAVLIFAIFMALSAVFVLFINFIINLFKKPSVFVDESTITYMGQTLRLDSITYLTLYLPEIKSKTSGTTQELSIYIDEKGHMVIKRPSVALIAHLRKRCANATFEIDELKSRFKSKVLIGLGSIVIIASVFYIAMQQ